MSTIQAKLLMSALRRGLPRTPRLGFISKTSLPALFAHPAARSSLHPRRSWPFRASSSINSALGSASAAPSLPPPPPLVVVVSGPSGVGKDAVIRRLQDKRPDLYFVVTATSRRMRPGEVDGVDYFFVNREEFEAWIAGGQLLEHAVVYGEYKGIPRQQVEGALARGTDVVLRVDVQGAQTMRQLLPGLVSVFLVAESEVELVNRLVARKTEAADKMAVRVRTAREEMARLGEFDYVVMNRDGQMEDTVSQIEAILTAEKARVARRCAAFAAELEATSSNSLA